MGREFNFGKMIHGGDYNPEQWLDFPEILDKDIEYFKKAKINEVSLGIFSWSVLEPCEGTYNFGWMEEIINRLWETVFPRSWQLLPVPVRNGWLINIRRFCGWTLTGTEICLAADIITVTHLLYTGIRCVR